MFSLFALSVVLGAFCPADNVPNFCGEKGSRGGTTFGDPVDLAHGRSTGYLSRRDFRIRTPFGDLEFNRHFASSWRPTEPSSGSGLLVGAAKPFGGAESDSGFYWWHDMMPVLRLNSSAITDYRTSRGRWVEFSAVPLDCGTGTVVPLSSSSLREPLSLFCSGSDGSRKFSVVESDGRKFQFEVSRSDMPGDGRLYPSEVSVGGLLMAKFEYAKDSSCGGSKYNYLARVEIPSTEQVLDLLYSPVSQVCPLSQVSVRHKSAPVGSGAPIARYFYSQVGSQVELRVAESDFGFDVASYGWLPSRVETYCGYGPGQTFRAYPGRHVGCVTADTADNEFVSDPMGLVTSAQTPEETLSIVPGASQTTAAVSFLRSSADGLASTSVTQTDVSLEASIGFHTGYAKTKTRTCPSGASCALNETREEDFNGSLAIETTGEGQSLVHTVSSPDSFGQFLPVVVQRGGTAPTGLACGSGGDCVKYSWTRIAGVPKLESEERASVLDSAQSSIVSYRYHSNGLLFSVVRSGLTKTASGGNATTLRHIGTFYRLEPRCAGPGVIPEAERIVEVEGPCFVSGPAAVTCDPEQLSVPVTHFRYYQHGATPSDVGRVMEVLRYPRGCNTPDVLSQTFSGYWPSGDPQRMTDENGHVTESAYDMQGRAVYAARSNVVNLFVYENDRLVRHVDGEGLETAYCYRNSTLRPDSAPYIGVRCDGPWTGRLEWLATTQGNPHQVSTNFFEAIVNEYSPAKTLLSRVFVKRAWGKRRRNVSDFDGDGNLAFVTTGLSSQGHVRRHGANGLPEALGDAHSGVSPLCSAVGGSVDPRCSQLNYDSAGRLSAVDLPRTTTLRDLDRLAYDSAGNLCGVSIQIGGPSNPNNPAPIATCVGGGGTQDKSDKREALYEHDDFGSLVRMFLPGSGSFDRDFSTGVGQFGVREAHVQEFSAAQLLRVRRLPDMVAPDSQTFDYDAVGRLLAVSNYAQGPVYSQTYDFPVATPCSFTQQNLVGRLSAVADPAGITVFSYDALGRVELEARHWFRSGECSETRYEHRRDGQVRSIHYSSGFRVNYLYDWSSRVSSIEIEQGIPLGLPQLAVWHIEWEPFGGVATYTARGARVDNVLGAGEAPRGQEGWIDSDGKPGECPTIGGVTEPNDLSGYPRWLAVRDPVTGDERLVEKYLWAGGQLLRSQRCYNRDNGGDPPIDIRFSYDRATRLAEARNLSGAANLGPVDLERFSYQPEQIRSFSAAVQRDRFDHSHLADHRITQIHSRSNFWPTNLPRRSSLPSRHYQFDGAGRVTEERYTPVPGPWSPGNSYAPHGFTRIDKYVAFGVGPLSSMVTDVEVPEGTWRYVYDASNRRRTKESPKGDLSEFSYNFAQQLVQEKRYLDNAKKAVLDNYVYLGGRLVLVARARADQPGERRLDGQGCEGM